MKVHESFWDKQIEIDKKETTMNCWHCNTELIWGGDFDFEDYGREDEGIVSNLSCPNEDCNAFVEVYLPLGENNEKQES